jgi:hypothetical protein
MDKHGWLRAFGVAAIAGLVLVSCGETPQEIENAAEDGEPPVVGTVDEGTTGEVMVLASPGPGSPSNPTPELRAIDAEGVEVSIENGRLNPDRLEGNPGDPFVLSINGDGTEYELVIENVVNGETIAAEGQTNVEFTVPEEPGEFAITLNGNEAGTFAAMSASGATD